MVRISKYLSYLLRHGAEKEGLAMRADGFARVEDIVSVDCTDGASGDWSSLSNVVVSDCSCFE